MINLLGFIAALLFCFAIRQLCFNKEDTPTAAGAIVMAIGIFLYSAMQQFSFYAYGEIFAFILAAIWSLIVLAIMSTLLDHSFHKKHLKDPVHLFAVGTWVAGTSVLGNVIFQFSLDLGIFPYIMGMLNILLYLWFLSYVFPAFLIIFKSSAKDNAHGVLLLPTVGTQSIVLLLYNIFHRLLPAFGNICLISFGILLYIIGFYLIFRRYLLQRNWNLADDWKNTNCIVHGAISITGLATVTTEVFDYHFQFFLWMWAIVFFVLIEAVELYRAILRIKKFGIVGGVGKYDVSQWSRNFTFGMLYAFTARFQLPGSSSFAHLRHVILTVGPWIVLLFLFIEIVIFFKSKLKWSIGKNRRQSEAQMNE
ncbi:hypothetical protein CFK37_11010 [Virgibacillus phasianinus]|uniref:Voltage-dependent anion channel n=1 Tax=Virgibacillus phasianinus TaxID=2017483 RepID=A0A220U4J1_9BACI|nr:hypothetical protein [Virgibacillus phasianinus]ASK62643.1 hypothetical protein CFK37_11010 [Virgibacillus phasianinus]